MLFFGLLLTFVFEYVRPGGLLPLPAVLNTVIPLGVFGLAVFVSRENGNGRILTEKNAILFMVFLGLMAVSVLTAEVRFYAYVKFKAVAGYVILFFLVAKLVTDVEKLKKLFATIVFIHILLVVLNPDIVLKPETRSYIRNVTFLGDGNDFSLSICIAIPMCLFLVQQARSIWTRYLFLAALGVLLFCIIGASSRGASIAMAAVFLYLWLKSRSKMRGVLALAVLAGIVVAYAPPAYFQRMGSVADYQTEGSAQGRILAWKAATRMALDHPLLGVGAGNFPTSYGTQYRPPEFGVTEIPWSNSHSIYFQLLGELGFPGLLLLLVLILANLQANEGRGRDSESRGPPFETYRQLFLFLNASIIAYAVAGAFLTAVYYPHMFVLAGLVTAARFMYERHCQGVEANGIQVSPPDAAVPQLTRGGASTGHKKRKGNNR